MGQFWVLIQDWRKASDDLLVVRHLGVRNAILKLCLHCQYLISPFGKTDKPTVVPFSVNRPACFTAKYIGCCRVDDHYLPHDASGFGCNRELTIVEEFEKGYLLELIDARLTAKLKHVCLVLAKANQVIGVFPHRIWSYRASDVLETGNKGVGEGLSKG